MSFYESFCPVKVLAGTSALEHMAFELRALGAERPMIVTDKGVVAVGLLEHVTTALEEGGIEVGAIFDDVPPDSSTKIVTQGAQIWRDSNCDSIIAVGGGSVMDTSKGINILASENASDLSAYTGAGALKRPLRPSFAIPTTAGTGSEVTLVAVISDKERGVKLPFASPFLLPNAAIVDPRMTLSLPPHLTAATAMDAMTHAIEAYICMAKNPISDAYATAAIKKISENLLAVIDDPKNVEGRLALAEAATMAGIAFSNSMTGVVHSIGHQLGALCHLHHGACMSLLLPYALEYNLEASAQDIGELLLHLEGAESYARTPAPERARAAIRSIRRLRDALHERCGLPRTLTETHKVEREQLPTLARMTLDDGALAFNPVEVDYEDALGLLERAWA